MNMTEFATDSIFIYALIIGCIVAAIFFFMRKRSK